MPDNTIKEAIKKFAGILRKKNYSFRRIYLFGSRAKRKQKEYSDIDVAVVVKNPGTGKRYLEKKMTLWKLSTDADSRIEPVLIGEKDFKERATTLANEVRDHGILIV